MRQAGIVAAAGLYALEHNLARLADDHAAPAASPCAWPKCRACSVDMDRVQTNMIFVGTRRAPGCRPPSSSCGRGGTGCLALDESTWSMRLVTHLDVDDAGVDEAVAAVRRAVAADA